ncbi:hypothetical protein IHE48_38320 [Frankia sp. CH37]|nr:hypothetical protein [Parafrankia sp. CH37]
MSDPAQRFAVGGLTLWRHLPIPGRFTLREARTALAHHPDPFASFADARQFLTGYTRHDRPAKAR